MDIDKQSSLEVLGYLKTKQIKQEQVAKFLGIGRTTLNRKLNGKSDA
ncbi:helix-turn-helix domain-containing protein [Pediococcus pentosaceus]